MASAIKNAVLGGNGTVTRNRLPLPVRPGKVAFQGLPAALGIPELRGHQARCIDAAVTGRDVLAVIATGGGKSESYYGAGLVRGGLTLIVGPLISLAHDQFRRLKGLGAPVALWNSTVGRRRKDRTLEQLVEGKAGYLLTTPESLGSETLSRAVMGKVSMAVIDESHCALRDRSFRTAFAWLGAVLDKIRPQVRYCCTATLPRADMPVLVRSLRLNDPYIEVGPVARDNITLHLADHDMFTLVDILRRHHDEPGIVFCATVRTAKEVHEKLKNRGWRVGLYHGKIKDRKKRKAAQQAFMAGDPPLMVATDSFLLGIDHPGLRHITHYDHPASIENWVQGFGRAGRDGKPADAYGCFTGPADGLASRRFLVNNSYPDIGELRAVWEYIGSAPERRESVHKIATKAIGYEGKYRGGNIISALKRFHLLDAKVDPEDKRRRVYAARNDFDAVDWTVYLDEKREMGERFEKLCRLARLPERELPLAISDYFCEVTDEPMDEDVQEDGDELVMSATGDYPASWDEVMV